MARKSALNPFATPYIPLSEMLSGMSIEEQNKAGEGILGEPEENKAANSLISGSTLSNEIRQAVKEDYFEKLPTKIGQHSGAPDMQTLHNENVAFEDFDGINDHATMIETLSSLFPDISVESLAEVLHVNSCNLIETIDMLEQFEDDMCDFLDLPETSEARNNFDPTSLEGSSSGTSNIV